MEGDKNDRPKWISTIFRQIVYDILSNNDPLVNLKKAVKDLNSGNVNPEEYQNSMTGINQVLKICWKIVNKSRIVNNDNNDLTVTVTGNKTVLQALALINDCYKYIMDLTTNGVVITDVIKFVQTNKEKLMSNKEDGKRKESEESDESDYHENQSQLEEKRIRYQKDN
jgi:hypothetical protein